MRKFFTAAFVAASLAVIVSAPEAHSADALEISKPFARASAGMAKNGAAFFTIKDTSGAGDRLIAASSDVAKRTELHTHIKEDGVFKMRQVEAIEVPAGGEAVLEPGGYHVMFMGLHKPLKQGEAVHITLSFEKAGEIMVMVPVGKVGAMGAQSHGDHSSGGHAGHMTGGGHGQHKSGEHKCKHGKHHKNHDAKHGSGMKHGEHKKKHEDHGGKHGKHGDHEGCMSDEEYQKHHKMKHGTGSSN